MRIALAAAFALALSSASAAVSAPAATDRDQIVTLAHQVMDAFNKGDIATVKRLSPAEAIIDEMPPFGWGAPGAMDRWLAAVDADNKRMKDTDGFSVLGPPTYIRIDGDFAYAVFPDRFRYRRAGHPVIENGTLTFNAHRTAQGWRVVAWTYSAGAH